MIMQKVETSQDNVALNLEHFFFLQRLSYSQFSRVKTGTVLSSENLVHAFENTVTESSERIIYNLSEIIYGIVTCAE